MVIDSFQKRFLMNMQLRQCISKAKPFRLKKEKQKKPDFVWLFLISKNAKGVQKKPEFQNLDSKKPNWQPCSVLSRLCWTSFQPIPCARET